MENQPLKFIELKQKNRRIYIYVTEDQNEELSFSVHTKRLIDFKSRKIVRSDVVFGYHTFKLLSEMMDHVLKDSELLRKTNRLDKYFQVEKATAKTNIKH